MSTTENKSTIEEKKNGKQNETLNTSPILKRTMLTWSIIFTIGIVFVFIFGTLGLYMTKIAQSNILPDDINLAPYTVIDRIVTDIPIDINIKRPSFFSENKDTFSQKATFNSQEYLDSFNNSFLCYFKKNAENPNGGLLSNAALFFSSVYDNIVAKNFLLINNIFFYLGYLPESIVMIICGFFGIFLWIAMYLFNLCISVFYHIANIPELFRNASTNEEKEWESYENIGFFNFGFFKFNIKLLYFCFIWSWITIISTVLSPLFFSLYGLLAPLYVKYDVKQINKTYNFINFIKNTFVYKKLFFIILATINLYFYGIAYLGFYSIISISLAVLFAYYMGLYDDEMPIESFSQGINTKIKRARVTKIDINDPEGILKAQKVKICQPVPIDNDQIKNIVNSGNYRKLTKPKQSGGDDYDLDSELKTDSTTNSDTIVTPDMQPKPEQTDDTVLEQNIQPNSDTDVRPNMQPNLEQNYSTDLEQDMQPKSDTNVTSDMQPETEIKTVSEINQDMQPKLELSETNIISDIKDLSSQQNKSKSILTPNTNPVQKQENNKKFNDIIEKLMANPNANVNKNVENANVENTNVENESVLQKGGKRRKNYNIRWT